jgi:hypothetical protein
VSSVAIAETQGDTIMGSFNNTPPSGQPSSMALRAQAAIVMAGSVPLAPVPDSLIPAPLPAEEGESSALGLSEPVHEQAFPPLTTQAANLFQAVVAFVGDGCGLVDDAT